ncbi:nucleotidyltransferase domain-containing protein, partial [Geminicoccus flavidas]|uniref:nucleotidyltransferase domain-containing protein n=1 Tax=Geminicoccus flavidas TaxID=2506407 RepID=UPI00190F3C6C
MAAVRAAFPDVVGIWFFGSAALGPAGPESDLDIAVLEPGRYQAAELLEANCRMADLLFWERIDLVDQRAASLPLRFSVLAEGRRSGSDGLLREQLGRNVSARAGAAPAGGTGMGRASRPGDRSDRGSPLIDRVVLAKIAIIGRCLQCIADRY